MQTIIRKSLLYKSGVEYADYCVNHVEGCSHGCRYPCYAMMMKKRCGVIKDYAGWIKPKIVANALELLDKEIPKLKDKITVVHLCFTTDPFMYKQKEVVDLSLKIIKRLNDDGIRCSILTKGVYPKKLLNFIKNEKVKNDYGITLVSLDDKFRNDWEPGSASFIKRIESLKYLYDNGLKTWVSMEPYPTPNLIEQDLTNILKEISFVDNIIFGKLNYNVRTSEFIDKKNFYYNRVQELTNYCETRNINYHVKHGTGREDNKFTEKILKREKVDQKVKLCNFQTQNSII